MTTASRRLLRTLALAPLVIGTLVVPAVRAADAATPCLISHPGTRIPVIFVHGFNSTSHTWDDDVDALNTATDRRPSPYVVAASFAYGNSTTSAADLALADHWVTDPAISVALADQIICVANASRVQGGPGRVVLVGHSMGGLAIRCATQPNKPGSSGCGPRGDQSAKVTEVITFGTPSTGSFLRGGVSRSAAEDAVADVLVSTCRSSVVLATLPAGPRSLCDTISTFGTSDAANAFAIGSPQLAALPSFSKSVAVHTVAGRASVTTSIGPLWHHTLAGDAGDLVVGTASARAYGQRSGDVGGADTRLCGSVDLSASAAALGGPAGALLFLHDLFAGLTCWHGTETSDDGFLGLIRSDLTKIPAGRWTDSKIVISGTTLGAATARMPQETVAKVAGVGLEGRGDGYYEAARAPGLGLQFSRAGGVCLFAGYNRYAVGRVRTPDGFAVGDSFATLHKIYGNRLKYSNGTVMPEGYYSAGDVVGVGWYVADNGGYLYFGNDTDGGGPTVYAITNMPTPPTAYSCGPG